MDLSTEKVAAGKVVTFRYTLTGEDGEVLDQSDMTGMPYLHGAGNIVPGLEREMEDRLVGDKFRAVIPPEDAYGDRDAPLQKIPRGAFPDDMQIEVGMQLLAQADDDEDPIPLWVVGTDAEAIEVDLNHPLAGMTLTFEVEVIGIREATDEELAHGHVHGPDAHQHH
jgi:FKBP-type peptidyl-prolyl cis-trans isomerase SlyD